jgi:hypothetical protein
VVAKDMGMEVVILENLGMALQPLMKRFGIDMKKRPAKPAEESKQITLQRKRIEKK